MYRIDNATAQTIKPDKQPVGVNPNGYFFRGSPSEATPATIVDDDWLNTIQDELANVVTQAGLTLDKESDDQLKTAIDYLHQKHGAVYAASSSAANTYTATLSPAPASYTTGLTVLIKFTNHNTGSATLNLNTLGAKTIKKIDGTNLSDSDIYDGMIGLLSYDGANFQLLNALPAQTPKIVSIKTQIFTSNGTYTPSAGMAFCEIEMVGGGGGSSGAQSNGALFGLGTGGGSAGYLRKKFTAAEVGATAAIVVGAGGLAGTANGNGGNGGDTTFTPSGTGAMLTCTGGDGGTTVQKSIGGNASGGIGGTATNGDVNINGQVGSGVTLASSGSGGGTGMVAILGGGAGTKLGEGGCPLLTAENTSGSFTPTGYGSAPGATFSATGQGSTVGTAGRPGIVIIREYCTQ